MQALRENLTVKSIFTFQRTKCVFNAKAQNGGFSGRKRQMELETRNNDLVLKNVKCFDVALCADCGQAFRWKRKDDGSFHGVIGERAFDITQNDCEVIFKNTDKETFDSLLKPYFDLERDYESILSAFDDEYLQKACSEYYGIRILHQDSWEALCSFIISQNNNIPRIKGIIERLCSLFGKDIGGGDRSFPSAEVLSSLCEADLAPLRAGFRSKYIIDAAEKCVSGEVSLSKLGSLPVEQARKELMKIKGVGPKVAECTLLYGFGKIEAFPVDVWVRRILSELYNGELPPCTKGAEGIAQQYLFHWRRNL